MNTFTVGGRQAELRWSYHVAASLGPWTLTMDRSGGGALTAQVVSADTFRVEQRPLTFRTVRQNAAPWEWPVTSLHIAGATLTAALGPQE